jgi:hypothetical protein
MSGLVSASETFTRASLNTRAARLLTPIIALLGSELQGVWWKYALFVARMQVDVRWCLEVDCGVRKTPGRLGPDCPLPSVTSLPRYGHIVEWLPVPPDHQHCACAALLRTVPSRIYRRREICVRRLRA